MTYDEWKTTAPDPGRVPEYCACGAELAPGEWMRCLLCDERIDLGRLDGPEDDENAEGE